MIDEAKQIEVNQAIEYLREDACGSCIFNSFLGECTTVSDCRVRKIADLIESLSAELEQVKRERDAAVEDILRGCHKCKHFKVMFNGCTPDYDCEYSDVCEDGDHWQWRGVQEVSHA